MARQSVFQTDSQSFTSKPNSPEYQLKGQSASLTWNFNSNGKTVSQILWFHNDTWVATKPSIGPATVLNSQYQVLGDATLRISNVQAKDNGDFDCQVFFTNSLPPVIKDTATLVVVVSPIITLKTTTAPTLDEGATRTLLCVASGNPEPTYMWYKDNIKIQEDRNNSHYTITSASRNDAGTYRCEAVVNVPTLGQYSDSYTVQVTVRFRPVHKKNSLCSNQTVLEGHTATFYCLTEAFPTATTNKWFKDGNEISNSQDFETLKISDTESRLTIKNATKGSAGQYSCDGTNAVGTGDRKSAFLLVNLPSSITQITQDQNVTEGDNLTLTCNASGRPQPKVSWIKPGGQRQYGHMLEFTNINRSQAGEYKCEASNECSNATETATIDVQYKPENVQLMSSAMNDKACMGKVISFTCSADANPRVTSYQLFENQKAILNTSASGTWSKTLESEGVFVYKCVANNSLGSDYSMDVPFTVNVPSSITQITQDQNVTEGDNFTLTCNASGMPQPNVSWIKPGGQDQYGHMLEFTNINMSQAGEYKCEASNECGNATETATIDVQYKPENVQLMSSAMNDKACMGKVISFTCSADANPRVTSYQLFENEKAILNTSASGTWSKTLGSEGVFIYKCVANNSLGSEYSMNVPFTVNVPSSITQITQDQKVTEGDNLTLTCNASGMPQPKVSWIKPGGQRQYGHMLEFTNINRSQAGEYKCEASNECGNATETATIDVQYKPENVQLMSSAMNDKVCTGKVISFTCSADANPRVTSYQLFENEKAILNTSASGTWSKTLGSEGVFIYKCVANNSLGSEYSMNVPFTVNVPSSITQITQDQNVTEGDNLTLTCNASGMPQPNVSWIKPGGQRHNGHMLEFTNINRSQAGEYKCEASNECGNGTETATIHVLYKSRITNISGEQIVKKGDEVNLFCLAEGNPAPKITWTKVADNSQVNFPLTIRDSQDEGMYRCTAENGVGSPVTKFVNMTVHFPAAIVAMGNHTVVKNGTIELYCYVSGTPPATVLWTHVKSGKTWNQKKWTVSDIQVEELGEYRCNASNKYGGDIKSTFILYEGGFCEKRCTDGKSCLKFGATYVCICPKGKTGEKCEKTDTPKKDFVVGLKLKGEFKQAYEDLENPETKTLVKKIEKNMMKEFNGTGLASVKVIKLRQGSIIADLELKFNNSVGESNVNALLTQAANKGKIGDMEVEEFSVGNNFPGPTTTSQPPEDCGTFFEGEDCKKAKPGLIVLCVIGGVAVLAIIVAIIAYGLHKKKSNVASFSNVNYAPRADPDGTAGSEERTLQGNNYGNVNSGYEYDKTNGQDHSTEMVTFKGTNPAQTPGIAIHDSSMTKC
ncbi:hemicentin-2-like isoform X2 [Pocillopora verrucosa]|uniref:hemicentin-2-like isoform X2 n=1 Tax=Pocillopora verrucosa TaxID=203993 RepID=UPI00334015E5